MARERVLAAVSTAQLAIGVAGTALAVQRRHAYHLPLLHGRPDKVARDALFMGTALSAPVAMLAIQGVAIVRLLRRPPGTARPVLGGLGAVMVVGYCAESLVRQRLRPSRWDRLESPLALGGIALAAAMGALGLTPRRPPDARLARP